MIQKQKSITLNLYCDEVKECPLKISQLDVYEKWSYMGMLIVPEFISDDLSKDLFNLRCLADPPRVWGSCSNYCKYHEQNNSEIHYEETNNTIKFKIARNWVQYWVKDKEKIYFYILGINLSKLDLNKFGPKEQQDRHSTIYNRFFRTAIKKALKRFFAEYDIIMVDNIYHDKGNLEDHEYFSWHSIYKLKSEEDKIYFNNSQIVFLDSDHRSKNGDPVHSQFIQLIDIILGCVVNCLHYNSTNKNKYELASIAYEIAHIIIQRPNNKNSRYNYFKRQAIEFFPKEDLRGLDENSLEYKFKRVNQFYTNRKLLIEEHRIGQISFFD